MGGKTKTLIKLYLMETKVCSNKECGLDLPLNMFYRHSNQCKTCHNNKIKDKRKLDPLSYNKSKVKWRSLNKDKVSVMNSNYFKDIKGNTKEPYCKKLLYNELYNEGINISVRDLNKTIIKTKQKYLLIKKQLNNGTTDN